MTIDNTKTEIETATSLKKSLKKNMMEFGIVL